MAIKETQITAEGLQKLEEELEMLRNRNQELEETMNNQK